MARSTSTGANSLIQDKYRQQQIALLNRQAAQLGLVVTPATSQAVSV
jgi:hypothetical protein